MQRVDPHRHAIFVKPADAPDFQDKTLEVGEFREQGSQIAIRFKSSPKTYLYGPKRACVSPLSETEFAENDFLSNQDVIYDDVKHLYAYECPHKNKYYRIFQSDVDRFINVLASEFKIHSPGTKSIEGTLSYLNRCGKSLSSEPLKGQFPLTVHRDTALRCYMARTVPQLTEPAKDLIFPFGCNLSQRTAVANALNNRISVIEGPPGTGKTQTILNLISNILVSQPDKTIAVVSLSNSAVDNIFEKLSKSNLSFFAAQRGSQEKNKAFFDEERQTQRRKQVSMFLASDRQPSSPDSLRKSEKRLTDYLESEKRLAVVEEQLRAVELEARNFVRNILMVPEERPIPKALARIDRKLILAYLAELSREEAKGLAGFISRIATKFRWLFKYGSLNGLGPNNPSSIQRLRREFYRKTVAELENEARRLREMTMQSSADDLLARHRDLSMNALKQALAERYQDRKEVIYSEDEARQWKYSDPNFKRFRADYPLTLSTCHSLGRCLPNNGIVDYLIVDEASQVDVMAACPAMSRARSMVVVGDQKQLAAIPQEGLEEMEPVDDYDPRASILASVIQVLGDKLPHQLLVEHYRCDPAIIGFCNRVFYDGQLIPYRKRAPNNPFPMRVIKSAPGAHGRRRLKGGWTNQREVDMVSEIINSSQDLLPEDIGVAAPYRFQVKKLQKSSPIPESSARTVHRYQGREKPTFILSTVIDEGATGREVEFVDNPELVNVAVSRAVDNFILVVHHSELPKTRHIRDLIAYISNVNYGRPSEESTIVSVFDLLYQEYSQVLRELASRLGRRSRFASENIIDTVLSDILNADFPHLSYYFQYSLALLIKEDALSRLQAMMPEFEIRKSSVDFLVYRTATKEPLLAIEVNGFKYHEESSPQLERDRCKDIVLREIELKLLRLPTTGSGEERQIRQAIVEADQSF